MRVLLNYNFNPDDIVDGNFESLFEKKRRDSTFACVYEKNGLVYAIRDHLGIVPLYFRFKVNKLQFSTNFSDLIEPDDEIDIIGLRSLLGIGTPRLFPLIKGIDIIPPGSVVEIDKTTKRTKVLYKYKIKTKKVSIFTSMNNIVEEADILFFNSIKRLVKSDKVGLYLSGGMDSALIGIYLKKLGIKVNAYTSAPDGKTCPEIPYAETNAKIIGVENHYIDYLETDKYMKSYFLIPEIYGIPHGTTTSIGVVSLWENTPIGNEQQIFFGQNSDTMTCSMRHQYKIYFRQILPKYFRTRISTKYYNMYFKTPNNKAEYYSLLAGYIFLRSKGFINEYPLLSSMYDSLEFSNLQLMTLAGMYFGHTPCDSEELSQPAIQRNILISNPYYDMDLIEFCLAIPLRFRISLAISLKLRIMLSLEKRVFRKLALKYLPKELVYRKRGFIVHMEKDKKTKDLINLLPSKILDIELNNIQSKVAAGVLKKWCAINGLKIG